VRWEQLPINTKFTRARRREVYRRLFGIISRNSQRELLPLDHLRKRVRLFEQTYRGVQPIPVDRIVGTAGRSNDFDAHWLPRRPEVQERWMRLERAFPDGDWPPIVVYQVGDSYFVVDGHHRVALAKQRGIDYIDAEVTELSARFPIAQGLDIGKMILAEQQHLFMEESGLERMRPEAEIELSQPHGYVEFLEIIKAHTYDLSVRNNALVAIEEGARDFYDNVYLPTIEAIHREGVIEGFPHAAVGDLFMAIYERRRSLFPEHGRLELGDVAREFKP
jgi:ParB-like nuclease family protein